MTYTGPLRGLGAGLRTLRVRAGLTQADVAERLGIQQSQVSEWENDQNLEVTSLERLLALFGAHLVDLGELLGTGTEGTPRRKTIDPEAIRREIDAALERLGVSEDESETSGRPKTGSK